MSEITVKEASIDQAVDVNATVGEFDAPIDAAYFQSRYGDHVHLILVAYCGSKPAGYLVGYDRYQDGSFYCGWVGVNPSFRKLGVLKALMEYQDVWAKRKGYNKVKVLTHNKHGIMLSYLVRAEFMIADFVRAADIADSVISLERPL